MKTHRMLTILKAALAVALAVAMLPLTAIMPLTAFGAVRYMPDVTAEMSQYQYWAQKSPGAKKVLATPEEIGQINQDIWAQSKETRDLANWSEETFNATAFVKQLISSATSDAQYLYNVGSRYYPDGTKADSWEALYQPLIDLCIDPDAGYVPGMEVTSENSVIMPDRYAV